MKIAVSVERLSKAYGGKQAVSDISFSIGRGTVFGLLGANGAGKTTTLECILGIKRPDRGTATVLGMNPFTERRKLFERTGVQFQEARYQEKITVEELCEVTTSLYRNAADFRELLKRFGIAEKMKSQVNDLSGGQRQRLCIVLALIPDPEVVFLDELTTGLDVKARREVWRILDELKKKGLTIFLTSHFMDEVEMLCDQICVLKNGSIVFQGTVAEAINSSPYEKLEDAYLWYAGEELDENENI